jgi:hypothetical protein
MYSPKITALNSSVKLPSPFKSITIIVKTPGIVDQSLVRGLSGLVIVISG